MAHAKGLPCMQFVAPYWELVLKGKLMIGDYAVKTRNSPWSYRGLVLFRTSGGKPAETVLKAHGLTLADAPQGIVGCGELVDTRELSDFEHDLWAIQVNGINMAKLRRLRREYSYGEFVEPCYFGYFFKNVVRFRFPIAWKPKPGPVNPVYVPTRVVEYALGARGITIKAA